MKTNLTPYLIGLGAGLGLYWLAGRRPTSASTVTLQDTLGVTFEVPTREISHILQTGAFVETPTQRIPTSDLWMASSATHRTVMGNIVQLSSLFPSFAKLTTTRDDRILINPDHVLKLSQDAQDLATGQILVKVILKNESPIVVKESLEAVRAALRQ
jgi:hypothetical protein